MTLRKVPSQAASGADTFSDNLVGNQITTGTGQLTNTNFALDSEVIQRDTKNFKTNPFSNFLTLDDLKIETDTLSTDEIAKRKKEIKFKGSKGDAGKSLFGSLKSRLGVSTQNIVRNFPAGILIDSTSLISTSGFTATNITYNIQNDTTDFDVEYSMLYNPFSVITITPKSKDNTSSYNLIRDFYNSFKKYVITVSGKTYNITSYTEPNSKNVIKLKVKGKPFTTSTYSLDILIRPNDGIVEEFFKGLDDLEESLLNRDSSPIYTASFKVPRDSFDQTKTELISVNYTWPVSEKDNWNIKIAGLEYEDYLRKLSDISDEIDDYKSNLFVRFLTSPQLFEFDSPDKKAESVFQLYGQSFDKVKKYIDNIAYMRNVSYDGINNVPDILLKNLANTLGLDTVNLIDEKGLDELLYTKTSQQYSGLTSGTSLLDAEFEFYRRLLVNLAYIYKSKGTRQSLEFFLRFLGAPEPMISINQYVYKVKSYPKSFNLEEDIYRATTGKYLVTTAIFLPTGGTVNGVVYPTYSYYTGTTTGSTSLSMEGYPVNLITSQPKSVTGSTDLFFQKGSGWYDNTASHKSPLVIDKDLSSGTTINGEFVLTGRTKTSVTKDSPRTYGEDYFNLYRTLPGLDTGYDLETVIDNTQTQLVGDESHLILNRKNIEVYLSSAQVVDYDIYRKSRDLELTFGTNSLLPQTGVTFAEYVDLMIHQQIKNSNLIKYKKNYITLEDIYQDYIKHTNYTFPDINIFIEKMSPYWTSVIDQIIPSTTLWTGGNLISNNIFGRPKYQYKYGCQPIKTDDYLNFDLQIPTGYTSYFDYLIQQADDDLSFSIESDEDGETKHDGYVKLYPVFEIDGIVYSGMTDPTNASALNTTTNVTGCTYVLISGATSLTGTTLTFNNDNTVTTNGISVKLYSGGTTNDLSVYSEIDQQLKILWKRAIQNTITYINTCTGCTYSGLTIDQPGKNNEYADDIDNINLSGSTTYIETNFPHLIPQLDSSNKKLRKKIISYEIFIDNEGYEKIKFTSYKYGPHDCTVNEYLDYGYVSIGQNDVKDCRFSGGLAIYEPGPTPTPTNTPIPTATPTATPSPTPTPLPATATPTPSPSPLPATATPTVTPSPATYTPTPTNTNTPTPTPTPTPDCSFDVEVTIFYPTSTPTPTPTPTPDCSFDVEVDVVYSTPTPTPTPTATPTPTPDCSFDVEVDVVYGTPTPTPTSTNTPTDTPTPTPTPLLATDTPTPTPTPTATPIINEILMQSGTTVSNACSNIVDLTYYYVGSFGAGTVLYTDSGLTNAVPGTVGAPRYYRYGNDVYSVNDSEGTLNASVPCPTPTPTPTPIPTTFTGYVSYVSADNACAGGSFDPYFAYSFDGVGGDLCSATSIYSTIILSEIDPNSEFWVSSGSQVRSFTKVGTSGNATPNGACVSCPTSTPTPLPATDTPTPTPSPTPDPNFYFLAQEYECLETGFCSYVSDIYISNDVDLTIHPSNPRYRLDPTSGLILRVMEAVAPQIALITNMSGLGTATCSSFCIQPATNTPLPTDTPTPTPSPEPATNTPTPTATPEPTYNSYFAEIHICGQCEYGNSFNNGLGGYVKFPSNYTAVVGKFYIQSNEFQDYSYKILNTVSSTLGGTLCSTTPYDSCYDACSQSLPTATPTNTPIPTNTPTPSPLPATDTPTPTPSPVPPTSFTAYISLDSGADACNGGSFSSYFAYQFNGFYGTMCDANSYIEGTIIQAEIDTNGYFWLSEGSGQSRYYRKSGTSNRAYPQESCVSCPTPVPTNIPTNIPTNTPTNTPIPTNTPTPTIDPYFYFIAERYECQGDGTCLYTEELFIRNNVDLTIAPIPRFRLDPTSGYILKVIQSTSSQIALNTTMSGVGTLSCSSFCTQPATSTPTPSPLPATDTPTPSPVPATDTPTPSPLPATDTPTPSPLPATDTPTPSPLPATSYMYQLGPSYTSSSQACENFGMDFYTTVYAAADQPFNVEQFFTDPNLVNVYTGENETHAFSLNSVGATPYSGNISYTGIVSNKSFCAEAP